jgi:GNAT superfamily N-acetyltransferase
LAEAKSTLRVRRYLDADHDEVWALHNLVLEDAGAHAGNGPWDDDLHSIRSVYLDDAGEFLVGLVDGEVVAMGALRRAGSDCAEITRMRIHPRFQRRGFGRLILERLEASARELGYERLRLDTTVGQAAAKALYLSHGYADTGRSRIGPFDVILFEKRLGT